MITTTESTKAFDAAFLAAQAAIDAVQVDKTNPKFKNRYPSLSAVLGAIKRPLNENGIHITQSPGDIVTDPFVALPVTTRLTHVESSEWMQITVPVPIEHPTFRDKKTDELVSMPINANKLVGAMTYGRRAGLVSLLALEEEDDDGAAASDQRDARPQQRVNGQPRERPINWQAVSDRMRTEIAACQTVTKLEDWKEANRSSVNQMPDGPRKNIKATCADRLNELEFAAASGIKAGVDPQAPPPDDGLDIPPGLDRRQENRS